MKGPKRAMFDIALGVLMVCFGALRLVGEAGGGRWFGLFMVVVGALWIAGHVVGLRSARAAAARRAARPPGGYAVRLVSAGSRPITVIKAVRESLDLDLVGAKALVDEPGSTVVSGVDEAFATDVAGRLRAAGATAEVVPYEEPGDPPADEPGE